MKKFALVAVLALTSGTFIVSTTQSCTTLATSNLGIAVIKQILLGGINQASNIFSNKQAFLQNDLILRALPENLRSVYNVLDRVAPNLANQGKDYIAQAAASTVSISTPILQNAVNSLNANDVTRIMQGEPGIATQILREKSQQQLIQAIAPKVDQKLNEFGIARSINMALQGSNLIGSIFGGQNSNNMATGGLSRLASEQMVNGLFNIIQSHEIENQGSILNSVRGIGTAAGVQPVR